MVKYTHVKFDISEKEGGRSMTVIIAEKPSLARNIAAGIEASTGGKTTRNNGFLVNGTYLVTWAFGHLFSLCDIEEYPNCDKGPRWSMDNLPCFPERFMFKLREDENKKTDSGVERQFNIIKQLCLRDDVDTIVNAGDSDREGEIIIRLCIENVGLERASTPKRLMRLWLPDQTPETVGRALSEMKCEDEYDDLANEGYARTYIDWLYGVNLTRYATLRSGTLLRVGRVIVPIVRAIYERDMAIRNFVPEEYFALVSKEKTKGEEIELISKSKFDKGQNSDALAMCELYNRAGAVVLSKKSKKETIRPGKLFSLSKLQGLLGKKYKMSMADSLAIVQKLYEEGYLTYPRTNSEYLATNEKDKVKKILASIKGIGYPVKFKDGKTIFDDSKIESHSALTPTYKIPKKEKLSEREMQVYQTVFRRFVAVFCEEDCIAQKTEVVIGVGDYEQFTLKGVSVLQKGFLRFDDSGMKDKLLPPLEKGDTVNIKFAPQSKQTSPPRHYTIETLNNYLKNPFREDKLARGHVDRAEIEGTEPESPDNDDEDYKAIFEGLELGTEATRTGIIDNARKSKYIELKKDVYTILPGGEYLIEQLSLMQISMDKYKTSVVGKALKQIFRGDITVDDGVELAKREIREVFEKKADDSDTGFYGDIIGKCPVCGRDIVRGRYGYGCVGYREGCAFKFGAMICRKPISVRLARQLLDDGQTELISGFISKKGNPFDASLKVENGNVVFVLSDGDEGAEMLGQCPVCRGAVTKYRFGYRCQNHSAGCAFRFNGRICEREICEDEARVILQNGISDKLDGFISKKGSAFSARLKLEGERLIFDFN